MFIYHANYSTRAPRLFIRPISPLRARTHTPGQPASGTHSRVLFQVNCSNVSVELYSIYSNIIYNYTPPLARSRAMNNTKKKRREDTLSAPLSIYTCLFPSRIARTRDRWICVCVYRRAFCASRQFRSRGQTKCEGEREREPVCMCIHTCIYIHTYTGARVQASASEWTNEWRLMRETSRLPSISVNFPFSLCSTARAHSGSTLDNSINERFHSRLFRSHSLSHLSTSMLFCARSVGPVFCVTASRGGSGGKVPKSRYSPFLVNQADGEQAREREWELWAFENFNRFICSSTRWCCCRSAVVSILIRGRLGAFKSIGM